MRRLLTLVCLLCVAVPAGITVSGCYRNPAANYCNGLGYGQKIEAVSVITMQPQTTGISLAFGQTQQVALPTAKTCKGAAASVSTYTYGTSNNQLVDLSPAGNLCAGTWNRNTGGGIANYTICSFPNPLPDTGGLPYASAFITASASGVTSNPVQVYVHPQVTSVALKGPTQCISQTHLYADANGNPIPLDAEACYSGANNKQYELCAPASITAEAKPVLTCKDGLAPGLTSAKQLPTCSSSIGALQFVVGTPSIASINNVNNEITAALPGTTVITASVAGSGSSAGYFSTCPPKSISLTLADGQTEGAVTQGVQQNLVTTVTDTNGNTITGLTLDYQSTNPFQTTAASGGGINPNVPGTASIYAVCQPSTCNPAPINVVGLNATGLSTSSNPVTVTTPGTASAFMWFAAPGMSQYFVPVELLNGTPSSNVRLPYVPNSMVMDQLGNNLYFGSAHELMVFSTANNALNREDPSVPGVVLAVSPNNSQLLINDPIRQVFYVYGANGAVASQFGGVGSAAFWTPDSKTLYVTDSAAAGAGHTNTLYVYNVNTGWTTYDLTSSGGAEHLALTIPGVGAYLSGNPTVAHTWCPSGTQGDYASLSFYPQGDSVDALTSVLAATIDGKHILGAALNGGAIQLSDIGVTIPGTETTSGTGTKVLTPDPCQQSGTTLEPLNITHTLNQTTVTANATTLNQIVASPAAVGQNGSVTGPGVAFITYTGATPGAKLPYYEPSAAAGQTGTVGYVTLTGASSITAPVAGAFSPDNTLFFVSTAGDNKIHYVSVPSTATGVPVDKQQLSPKLPACVPLSASDPNCVNTTVPAGGYVPATVITVKPRTTT